MSFETDLHERLAAAAGRATTWAGDDGAAADAVIDRRRAERRHRAIAAAVVVCLVVVLAVLVPVLNTVGDRGAPANPTPSGPTSTATLWDEPARGSLAGDAGFLADARALDVPNLLATALAPLGTHRVVFAGDEGGTRWVLVSGVVDGQLLGQWYLGPEGAAADDLETGATESALVPHQPIGFQVTTDAGSTVLVLADPGDTVAFSSAANVGDDGTVQRQWTSGTSEDGSEVFVSGADRTGSGIRYRVVRGGAVVATGPTAIQDTSTPVGPDPAEIAGRTPRRPSTGPVSAEAVRQALQAVLGPTGLHPSDVAPVVLWAGPIPSPSGTPDAVVLAITLPNGPVVTTTAFAGVIHGSCGSAIHPAGTALDDLVVVAACPVDPDDPAATSVVVTAPPAADTVRLIAAPDTVLQDAALLEGSAVRASRTPVNLVVVSVCSGFAEAEAALWTEDAIGADGTTWCAVPAA
jgi:hypothetical protein